MPFAGPEAHRVKVPEWYKLVCGSEPLFVIAVRDAHDQYRLAGAVQDLVSGCAQQRITDHAMPMRTHDDQVDIMTSGIGQNYLCRVSFFNLNRVDPVTALRVNTTFLFSQSGNPFSETLFGMVARFELSLLGILVRDVQLDETLGKRR